MRKKAQYSSLLYSPTVQGKTLADLYMAIRADYGLPQSRKSQLVQQIQGMVAGAPVSTPLSSLLRRGLGGIIGWLISKYFGMGPVGQLVSATAGYGIGKAIDKQLNKPKSPFPGWRI
jgi:hypothetical protein